VYEVIARHLLAPSLDLLRGTKTMKRLEELERTQWWPRHRVLALQQERLSRLTEFAYRNTSYYRSMFENRGLNPRDMRGPEDLAKLPVLTKQLVRGNFAGLVAQRFPEKERMLRSTGGSTGEPLSFYRTRDDFYGWGSAAELRAYGWAGYRVGDKCALLWERYPCDSTVAGLTTAIRQSLLRTTVLDALKISAETLPVLARRLRFADRGFIRGYPAAIYMLARFIERGGAPGIRPKAIITSGEELHGFQRELYSRVFRCEAFSCYGSEEITTVASECAAHSGLHVSAENVVLEVVDDEDMPVPPGREGRILTTSLHNYAMPLIRYDTGDTGVISDRACRCGRGLPLLETISGRTADVIVTRSGKTVPGSSLRFGFLASLGVEQFQIVQETYEEVVVKLVVGAGFPRDRLHEVAEQVRRYYRLELGEEMDIAVEFVDEILPTRSGKRRFVVSHVPQTL
jgi:phenylacetate-CoA ligase